VTGDGLGKVPDRTTDNGCEQWQAILRRNAELEATVERLHEEVAARERVVQSARTLVDSVVNLDIDSFSDTIKQQFDAFRDAEDVVLKLWRAREDAEAAEKGGDS